MIFKKKKSFDVYIDRWKLETRIRNSIDFDETFTQKLNEKIIKKIIDDESFISNWYWISFLNRQIRNVNINVDDWYVYKFHVKHSINFVEKHQKVSSSKISKKTL